MDPALWGLNGGLSIFGVDEGISAAVEIPDISTVDTEELTGGEAVSACLLLTLLLTLVISSTVFTDTSLTVAYNNITINQSRFVEYHSVSKRMQTGEFWQA